MRKFLKFNLGSAGILCEIPGAYLGFYLSSLFSINAAVRLKVLSEECPASRVEIIAYAVSARILDITLEYLKDRLDRRQKISENE